MKERILEFLRTENKSSAVFAEEIGVQPSSISHILSGRNNPSLDFVIKMLKRYPYLSSDWILFGKGSMYSESSQQELFSTPSQPVSEPGNNQLEIELENNHSTESENHIIRNEEHFITGETSGKKAIRIVYFFNDSTFREYYPDGQN